MGKQAKSEVNNLGDVTESKDQLPLGEIIEMQPISDLPESHKHMASIYPGAKGFTLEGGSVALHF